MIDEPLRRSPLPPVPLRLLFTALGAQPRQILPVGANLQQLKLESLTFDAAWNTETAPAAWGTC